MNPPSHERQSTLFGVGIVVALVAIVAVILFLPIASCPNCLGEGSVDPQVNADWIRTHPVMLHRGSVEFLGRASCVRCGGRGRVTTLGRLAQ